MAAATRFAAIALALLLALVPAPGAAVAPVLLALVKQIVQQAAESMIKDMLLSSLDGMGCKGIALQKAFAAFELRRSAGGLGGIIAGGLGVAVMPGMPDIPGMPSVAGLPSGAGMTPEIKAKMSELMPGIGELPQGTGIDADMLARVQQMMGKPLSPADTLATIDDLAELGFLPKDMQTELKQCMVLLPESIAALGMGMGMLKPMVPQLQQARAELRALPAAEQDEVAAALLAQVKELPAEQRAALLEYLDGGFSPPRVVSGVREGVTRL